MTKIDNYLADSMAWKFVPYGGGWYYLQNKWFGDTLAGGIPAQLSRCWPGKKGVIPDNCGKPETSEMVTTNCIPSLPEQVMALSRITLLRAIKHSSLAILAL